MASRKYFGTDGIRGIAGRPPLTPGLVLRLGRAVACLRGGPVIVGRDTRLSSPALRDAVCAGLMGDGADVVDVGVLPTPAVAGEVAAGPAAAGVMITASHNPWQDNGIKVFASDGTKLDDDAEIALEAELERIDPDEPGVPGSWSEDSARAREAYLERLRPDQHYGAGLRVMVDAANGAASDLAVAALEACGATVIGIACDPDGRNINEGCGALHPRRVREAVRSGEVDLGVALDGDADRCLVVHEGGEVLDGDVLIAMLAMQRGLDDVVGTVMTNEGVVRHLADAGITVHRSPVGDRNVLMMMREVDTTLGGESSGHVIQLDRGPAGDGLATALAALELRRLAGRKLSRLAREIPTFPYAMRAVKVAEKVPLEELPDMQDAIAAAEERLADKGRTLVRYSGTESVLRVFIEGADRDLVREICDELSTTAERLLGGEEA